jgi:hypothetical protein
MSWRKNIHIPSDLAVVLSLSVVHSPLALFSIPHVLTDTDTVPAALCYSFSIVSPLFLNESALTAYKHTVVQLLQFILY